MMLRWTTFPCNLTKKSNFKFEFIGQKVNLQLLNSAKNQLKNKKGVINETKRKEKSHTN